MIKKAVKKYGRATLIAVVILSGGWSLTTSSGSSFLANSSAILVRSWSEVFGAATVVRGSSQAPPSVMAGTPSVLATSSLKKAPVAACWDTEREDLAKLTDLLRESNISLVDLAHQLANASGTCPSGASPAALISPGVERDASAEDSSARNIIPGECAFPVAQDSPGAIVLNEIAWMGGVPSPGETSAKAGNREWIELKNISTKTVTLNGWQVRNVGGSLQVVFGANDEIPPGGFYLLSRSGNPVAGVAADVAYSGALSNSGDSVAIFDAGCGIADFLDGSGGWPAGNNTLRQTMERTRDGAWETSARPGGTPRAENSGGLAKYSVNVSMQGDGEGSVTSNPLGITCNAGALAVGDSSCSASFVSGTVLDLIATPSKNAKFTGWSGGCSGSAKCKLTVAGTVSVTASFTLVGEKEEPLSEVSVIAGIIPSSSFSSSSFAPVLIAAVQIAGAVSSNDFIKLYNPNGIAVDISGWKLRKKSSTGSDASLREFPKGTFIAAGASFTWANSLGSFAQSIGADASSSQTVAADNSVALFDANGALMDALAWGIGVDQYVEGAPYATNPISNQALTRKSAHGTVLDTNNNAEDFSL